MEDFFESDNQRELRQIWQAQSSMTEALRELSRKMDEVIGRQERTLGLLSVSGSAQGGGAAPPPIQQQQIGGQQPPVGGMPDTIRRHEVEALISNNNYLVQVSKELRTILGEVQARTDTIITNQARQPTAQIQSAGYDYQQLVSEMRDGLNQVRQGIAGLGRTGGAPQAQAATGCPSCVSVTMILVITAVQLILMLAYSLFK